jgi:chorismate lyase
MQPSDFRPVWQADPVALERGVCAGNLPPAWAMLLFGDGSPTRHLGLATGRPVGVEVVSMAPDEGRDTPAEAAELAAPLVRREVWLTHPDGARLAHAVSWWPASAVQAHIRDRALPIWASLADRRTELFRDLRGVALGRSPSLETAFGSDAPLWRRRYLFWRDGRPLTLIVETFSPALDRWLGPSTARPGFPDACPDCASRW